MSQLRHFEEEINLLNIRVLVVTFESGPLAEAYVRDNDLSWPLLVDSDRSLYAAYDMHRGSWRDILAPENWSVYAKLLMRGRKLHRSTGDVRQLGGNVLIDPTGIVRLHHVSSGPADRPSIASLLDVVRQAEQTS